MKSNLMAVASLVLVSALTGQAQTAASTGGSTSAKMSACKAHHHRPKAPTKPSVEMQIESLRQDMETQIQALKQQLADRDAQLRQMQQSAAQAQATAQQTQQAAQSPQQAQTENAQTVSSLQGAVADLKTTTQTSVARVQHQQAEINKAIAHPDELHFKGITLSPTGSFLAAETAYRNHATGGGLNTQLTGIPLENSAQAHLSEFVGTGRQSRLALLAQGKLDNMTLRGYYETDFLSAADTSNNNQSNSYSLRQRQVWAQAELNDGLTFTGGQMWSLATETKAGMTNRTEVLPQTIDPQYEAGFVWARQYSFRVTKNFHNRVWIGMSAENPQVTTIAGHGFSNNFLIGQAGNTGGLLNNRSNYAYNLAPDLIAKVVYQPTWGGHYELFGIGRFFRDRVYPNATATTPSSAGAYNDDTVGGGIGGGFRIPTFRKKVDLGLKGLWGDGVGRYGSSTLPDTTVHPDGQLALLHGFSTLASVEPHITSRLDMYFNYGGDYAYRRYFGGDSKAVGYGAPTFNNTGCAVEPVPGGSYVPGSQKNCTADTKDVQEGTVGYWYDFYKGPKGRLRQGFQYSYIVRNTWSGIGGAPKGVDDMFFTSFRYYLP